MPPNYIINCQKAKFSSKSLYIKNISQRAASALLWMNADCRGWHLRQESFAPLVTKFTLDKIRSSRTNLSSGNQRRLNIRKRNKRKCSNLEGPSTLTSPNSWVARMHSFLIERSQLWTTFCCLSRKCSSAFEWHFLISYYPYINCDYLLV